MFLLQAELWAGLLHGLLCVALGTETHESAAVGQQQGLVRLVMDVGEREDPRRETRLTLLPQFLHLVGWFDGTCRHTATSSGLS